MMDMLPRSVSYGEKIALKMSKIFGLSFFAKGNFIIIHDMSS